MSLESNCQYINQKFHELSELLIQKLEHCYVTKDNNNSFTELIQAVEEIKAVEVDNKKNVKPTSIPALDNTNLSTFYASLYNRVRYYMKLLGYYLVLKGVPIYDVNAQTDLKGLIELIDNIDVIKPSFLTLKPINNEQNFGTNIVIDYTLKDIDGNDITDGDIIITDSHGTIYPPIPAGKLISITPLDIGEETYTIIYNGALRFLPSEPQTFSANINPAHIYITLTATNMTTYSKYFNSHTTGYESDIWEISIKASDYEGNPIQVIDSDTQEPTGIPFNLTIPDILSISAMTDDKGYWEMEDDLVIEQVGNHTITCETTYGDTSKLSNTTVSCDVVIKYNILKQTTNKYTDYTGKTNYTYTIDVIDEDTGVLTSAYNNKKVNIFLNNELITTTRVTNKHITYSFDTFAVGEHILRWELTAGSAQTRTYINILSNFILPNNNSYFLNDTPQVIYAPLGVKAPNNTVNGTIYIKTATNEYTENITPTTNNNGVLNIIDTYKYSGQYTLTLNATNGLTETIIFDYELKLPFAMELYSYKKKEFAQYKVLVYDMDDYDSSCIIVKNGNKVVNPNVYTITPQDNIYTPTFEEYIDDDGKITYGPAIGQEENKPPDYQMLIINIPANESTYGTNTITININGYEDTEAFKLANQIFVLDTQSVELGYSTMEIQCNDSDIENILIESDSIDVNNIKKNNNIFEIKCEFKKAGNIPFKIIDETGAEESFVIKVNKQSLAEYIDGGVDIINPADDRSTTNCISYFDIPNAHIYFNIDKYLYLDKNNNNEDIPLTIYYHYDNNTSKSFTYPNYDNEDLPFGEDLLPGEHTITFVFNGNNNYTSFNKTIPFTIIKGLPTYEITQKYSVYRNNNNENIKIDANADFIFKKGNYTNTYIIIEVEGVPNGETLQLRDENLNPLYSPYNTSGNKAKTQCTMTVGQSNIISLPANYTTSSSYTDFEVGTYNWKLYFPGNNKYEDKELSFTVDILDFKTWEILTPTIYPNEDIKVQLKTYVNTNPASIDADAKTQHSQYNASSGIVTYPNIDITNINVGHHIQTINASKKYILDYEVKNPIEFVIKRKTAYSTTKTQYTYADSKNLSVGGQIFSDCTLTLPEDISNTNITNILKLKINSNTFYNYTTYYQKEDSLVGKLSNLIPDTYNCTCTLQLSNNKTYTCMGNFEITTANCTLYLDCIKNGDNNFTLVATYKYGSTAITEAPIRLINTHTQEIQNNISYTNNNGVVSWSNMEAGIYKAVAVSHDGTYVMESNIIDLINVYSIITDVSMTTDNKDNLLINDITTLDLTDNIYYNAYLNEEGNLIVESMPLIDFNKNNNVFVDLSFSEQNNYNLLSNITKFSDLENNANIISNIYFDDGIIKFEKQSSSYINEIGVVTDVDINSSSYLDITKQQYIDIGNFDDVMSDIDYTDEDGDIVAKTIQDKKTENFNNTI